MARNAQEREAMLRGEVNYARNSFDRKLRIEVEKELQRQLKGDPHEHNAYICVIAAVRHVMENDAEMFFTAELKSL